MRQDAYSRVPLLTPSKMLEVPTSIEVALTEARPANSVCFRGLCKFFHLEFHLAFPCLLSSKSTNLKKPSIFPSNGTRRIFFKLKRQHTLDLGLFHKEAILFAARQFRCILALTDGRRALCISRMHPLPGKGRACSSLIRSRERGIRLRRSCCKAFWQPTAEDDDVAPGLDITQDFHIQIPACTLTKPREVGQNLLKFSHL